MFRYGMLVVLLATWCTPALAFDPKAWVRSTEIFTRSDNLYARGTVFVNTFTEYSNPPGCARDVWCVVDLSDAVLPDAKSAFLSGMLLVTAGTAVEIADLHVAFKAVSNDETCPVPQTATCAPYVGQAVVALPGGGTRAPLSLWVPLEAGKFHFKWTTSTSGPWPEHASYGVNLTLTAWTR